MRHRFILATVLLSVSLLGGCGKIKKGQECNTFIDKVNTSLQEIERASKAKGDDDTAVAADMRKLADLYQQLAADVAALDISTPELKQSAKEYQEMAKRASATARRVAEAIETKDLQKATAAQKEFDAIVKQEDQLVGKINSFCQS